ncbi:hypothetical protein Dsin_014470 [Dipteronia sinensis]|uniref:Reverse transcriptase domain-containing protein n=1 Tax=Dipteronia sinensis TaxID=43782 RepID=A0AAE0AMZ0_9ROSI|nr:hypothetical protein Dsin_014470 [Dipteronia sinensis]
MALEEVFSEEEVWAAVTAYGGNKVPGPDGLNLNFVKANWEIYPGISWGLVVKLDFEKAYDSVDHSFLDEVMKDIGFGERWGFWVQSCISTPMLSVLVNGSPMEEFALEKDDTMFFLEPNMEYLVNTKRILRCFEISSGLKINFHKSCVVKVGKKVAREEDWEAAIKCKKETLPISYLGLPLGARPNSKCFWDSVLLRIEKRLAPWKKKFLSKGGRLVLIKAVLSSFPTYFMSIFKVPVNVAQSIEKCR